jgi:hypothetical protein
MARGRRADSSSLVAQLPGSRRARQRLDLMLQTLKGVCTIPQAARALGIARSRFCRQRQEMLQAALESLEPKPRGRPPLEVSAQQQQIADLQAQVQALKIDLQAAQIREQLALLLPHVLTGKPPRRKKNATVGRSARPLGRGRRGPAARGTPRPDNPADRSGHAG